MEKKIYDNELGTVTIRSNARIKRYSLNIKQGLVYANLPEGGSEKKLLAFIHSNKDKLIHALKKYHSAAPAILNEETALQTNTFRLHIFRSERTNVYMSLKEGILHIACPQETNFADEQMQQILKKLLEKALRHEAHRILPARLQELAARHSFVYSGLRIAHTKTRWGSCSSKRHINLSISLMLLPDHLIDYVILHELCHTLEMNHSPRFWAQLNKVTANQALSLRKELKTYHVL
jgi:predicted metal-dependent hydrolase